MRKTEALKSIIDNLIGYNDLEGLERFCKRIPCHDGLDCYKDCPFASMENLKELSNELEGTF